MSWEPTLAHYLILSAAIFSIGMIGVMVRRNAIILFMSIELMLNAVNLTFIAFSRYRIDMDGHIFAFFVMAVAAAEAAVALAIVLHVFRHKRSVNVDEMQQLQY
ncbi:NADH-quinone oxidoreductase subunit NuoK [Lujinxingia vulgaris]|uniref:NADH-quinone oxidoreductase subunit K n=2 Tax=Lujinxingia TaxID=2653226 RepID=A0A5C6XNS7_9DELT|nr:MULTISPECIES: NADH-quinone oxidoreductase subunit NuoK [Lujinxingia]RDV39583.1 NADH-quinone oxidoreductase subunit NuoK [Bradymonadaceae bacterium TMQ3]TXC77674.1 NADH-quinone oxidoreductase subunit NuoK [Bradymonadales bacterium TMQ1]RVU48372.1 NADH-quinone oxidoreductase subunit NuoK [Lujinxingia sediminis]TXD39343.1 NADH-quinone oxidoreductase subunit NuoK [Lujinxingia vulgaris]TXD43739.1 NADH-quinone oxidoreductase subunit NuoK [Lujinxingia vulgaris]